MLKTTDPRVVATIKAAEAEFQAELNDIIAYKVGPRPVDTLALLATLLEKTAGMSRRKIKRLLGLRLDDVYTLCDYATILAEHDQDFVEVGERIRRAALDLVEREDVVVRPQKKRRAPRQKAKPAISDASLDDFPSLSKDARDAISAVCDIAGPSFAELFAGGKMPLYRHMRNAIYVLLHGECGMSEVAIGVVLNRSPAAVRYGLAKFRASWLASPDDEHCLFFRETCAALGWIADEVAAKEIAR